MYTCIHYIVAYVYLGGYIEVFTLAEFKLFTNNEARFYTQDKIDCGILCLSEFVDGE